MTRQSQVDHVYEALRAKILDGSLPQAYVLNERAVAELVGTSRTPVREAVARLVEDGLAERGDRRTPRVTVWDEERVGQVYEMRSLLESEACRLAAMRRSESAVLRLEDALMEQRDLAGDSPLARRDLNYRFHREIWAASANPFLLEANTKYGVQSMCITPTTLRSDERWDASLQEHEELVAHIAAHRAEPAAELMRDHLRSALRQR